MTVMLIDDDSFILRVLTRQLRHLGLQHWGLSKVSACTDGQKALEAIEHGNSRIKLILCDLQMPGLDGVEMLRKLSEMRYPGALILVSGEDDRILHAAERLARALRLKVLGVLRKPVTEQSLSELLDRLSRESDSSRASVQTYSAAEVRNAIASEELINAYQPKVDVASGEVIGVEALVRWRHPRDGLLTPDHFIGIAEANGLMDDLTREVLSNALVQAVKWRQDGLDLSVAVNVSVKSLIHLDFPDYVAREAASAGVPLDRLKLELTESEVIRDVRTCLDILTRLRLKQIGLSIDDFGTGYSSLAQLRDLPFNELKIDYGFVHGACHDAERSAIVEASLNLARQLGINVVAEGAEDIDDWNYLRACGASQAQGYFIARPLPGAELPGWVATWNLRRPALLASAA